MNFLTPQRKYKLNNYQQLWASVLYKATEDLLKSRNVGWANTEVGKFFMDDNNYAFTFICETISINKKRIRNEIKRIMRLSFAERKELLKRPKVGHKPRGPYKKKHAETIQ